MSEQKIKAVWESPTSEETACYSVGGRMNPVPGSYSPGIGDGLQYEWTVGKIVEIDSNCYHEGDLARFEVYDTNGKKRVSLPVNACAFECEVEGP